MTSLELIIGFLGLPLLGGLMQLFVQRSRSAIDRQGRDFSRSMLKILGWIALLHVPFFLITLLTGLTTSPGLTFEAMFGAVARSLIGIVCLWSGLAALQVSGQHEWDELSARELAVHDQQITGLHTASLILVGIPLLIPGLFLLLPFSVFLLLEDFFGTNRRMRENRLLWLMSLAVQHDRPVSGELRLYSMSLEAAHPGYRFWTRRGIARLFARNQKHELKQLNLVINDLEFGVPLGQTLLGRSLLSPNLVASINAAERGGYLKEALPEITVRHTRDITTSITQESVFATACYVWIVGLAALQVLTFVMYYIIPKHKEIFLGFGVELPDVTLALIHVGDLLAKYWFLLAPLLTLAIGGVLLIQRLASGNHRRLRWLLRWFPRMESPQLLDQISNGVARSSPLPDALESLAVSELVDPQRRRLERLQMRLRSGDPLAEALFAEGLVTRRERAAIEAAARLNHLPWTLHALSRRIQQRRREIANWFIRLAEPLLILTLGAFALFYCVGTFMPLIKLLQDLS